LINSSNISSYSDWLTVGLVVAGLSMSLIGELTVEALGTSAALYFHPVILFFKKPQNEPMELTNFFDCFNYWSVVPSCISIFVNISSCSWSYTLTLLPLYIIIYIVLFASVNWSLICTSLSLISSYMNIIIYLIHSYIDFKTSILKHSDILSIYSLNSL
jgi:hypothetical protein